MRRLLVVIAAAGVIAWSAPAWAVVVDTVPQTTTGQEIPEKSLTITFKDKDRKPLPDKPPVRVRRTTDGHLKVDVPEGTAYVDVRTSDEKYRGRDVDIDTFKSGKFLEE